MLHRMIYRSQEYLDHPSAPLVERVRFLVGAVEKAKGFANHPDWEVGVGR